MKNYELVLMLKVSITEAERKAVISEIESKYKVLDKDEIGIKDLYYTVKGGIRQAYFVSYCMELSAEDIADLKKSLLEKQIKSSSTLRNFKLLLKKLSKISKIENSVKKLLSFQRLKMQNISIGNLSQS